MATTYYPPLWLVLPLDKLPVEFAVLKDFLSDATDDIRYRNLATDRTASGDYGSYALDIVLLQPLGLEIPGTGGLALLVNPAGDGTSITAIPVECQYSWPVVRFVRDFSLESFSGGARSLFDLVVAFMGVTKEQLLAEVIAVFIADPDPIAKFVTDFNAKYSPQVLLSTQVPQGEDVFGFVTKQIAEAQESFDLLEIIFNDYIAPGFDLDAAINRLRALARRWLGEITVDDVRTLLVPSARVGLPSLTVGLRFPRAVLREVDLDGKPLPDPNEPMADKPTLVIVDVASLEYSTAGGLEFDLTDGLTIDLPPSEILKSGIILKAKGLKVDFSRTTNIPEATADGRPADFVGVYIDSAEIVLPKKWFKEASPDSKAKIIGKSVIVGTGGFSGTIGLDSAGVFKTKLGGFEAELQKFSLRFERNSIIESDITGTMVIKGFKNKDDVDATIKIRAHIGQDGDFSVTASEPQGVLIKIPDILELNVRSLGFGREDDRFFVETSGTLTLTLLKKVHGLRLDKDISAEVKKLIIWEDGQIEIQGGTIILPEAISLQIGPVKLSVTALSMGSYARNGHKYKYFGFDGGVNVNPGGVDVRASGVKVYWRTDAPGSPPSIEDLDIFVRVEGIAIDLIIPGGKSAEEATVLISGFLQVKESDGSDGSTAATEYAGGVSFKLPKAGIGGSAAMRLNPSIPAFIIDTELSISVPIPLGNTSLGIYGFRGLIGMRYVADRKYIGLAEDAEWYQYYKKKLPPTNKEGINIAKFEPRKGFAIGAGVTIATLTDSGKAFSAKLFLLLSLPDALLLQGQAAILAERVDLSQNDPPFFVFIAITKQSVEAAFGVTYKLPEDSGAILDFQALIEMGFYFNDATAWYINAGRNQPTNKRITARILSLFNGWSYLMLSAKGIQAGAGVSWGFSKSYGPIAVEASAYLDAHGRISFKPKQIGGAISLGGSASVRVFKFKLGVSIAAVLAAEAPKPFIVTGSVRVTIDLPRPFRKLGGTLSLDFTWNFDSTLQRAALPVFNDANVSEAVKMVNIATRERFAVNVPSAKWLDGFLLPAPESGEPDGWTGKFNNFIVPLDCTADIEFKKPIAPSAAVTNIGITGIGYQNVEMVPPQRGASAQVRHQYVVEEVKIRAWNSTNNEWEDYDVYGALTPLQHAAFLKPSDLIGLKQGWWQTDSPGKTNKLSILSQTPFSYAKDVVGPFVPENSGVTAESIFCTAKPIEPRCFVVDEMPELKTLIAERRFALKTVQVRVTGKDGTVVPFVNGFGLSRAIALKAGSQMEIFFPELTGKVSLRLATLADNVTVAFQQRRQMGLDAGNKPIFEHLTVKRQLLTSAALLRPLQYDSAETPIDKILITAGPCDCREVIALPVSAAAVALPAMRFTQQQFALLAAPAGVNPPELLLVDKSTLMFTAQSGAADPAAQTVQVTRPANREPIPFKIDYTTSSGGAWLTVNPPFAFTPAGLVVTAKLGGLAPGAYGGTINLLPSGAENVRIAVRFLVTQPVIAPPKCGSLAAYGQKTLTEAQQRLEAAKREYDQLITRSKEYADLSKQFIDNHCDPTLSTRFTQIAKELAEQGAALLEEIRHLTSLIDCLRKMGAAKPDIKSVAAVGGKGETPKFDCNIDPGADYSCLSLVFGICWLPLKDQFYNDTIPSFSSLLSNNNAMVTAISKTIHPIWRPDTIYAISIKTVDNVSVPEQGGGTNSVPKYMHIGFRTKGPLGHFHEHREEYTKLVAEDRQDQYRLQSLKTYIDYSKSYPNADGNVLNAKPLFYGKPKLSLFYIHPYVYTMFGGQFDGLNGGPGFSSTLEFSILDPVNPLPKQDEPGYVPRPKVEFGANQLGRSDVDVKFLHNMATQGNPCTGAGEDKGIAPMGIQSDVVIEPLRPLKLYLAVVKANFKGTSKEIHRYNFQTSRYADFAEQVNSYRLKDAKGKFMRDAVYDDVSVTLEAPRRALLTALLDGNYPAGDPLEQEYPDRFDRLMDGILRVGPIDPPTCTDFTIIRDGETRKVLGILVRNPEPFIDPKTPESDAAAALTVKQQFGLRPKAFRAMFSKDRSRAFVSEGTLNMPLSSLEFTFRQIEYDGASYKAVSSVVVKLFPLTVAPNPGNIGFDPGLVVSE